SRYQAIIDHAVGEDVDIRAAAVRGLLAARYPPTSSFISVTSREAAQIPLWARLVAGASLVLVMWGLFVRLIPRAGTRIAFEELSTDRDTRLNRSKVLTALMVDLLTPRQLSAGELSMDIMPGTDEPGFSNVTPALERDVSTSYEVAEHPVKIASVEFF